MNLKARITEKDDPQSKPIYIVDYKTLKVHPKLIFRSTSDETDFATGTLHPISINADCEIRGKPIELTAMKRFKTEYQHISPTYSDTGNPVAMTWTSSSSFTKWDFICLDPQQLPVAKYSANIWALQKVGDIEFLGPSAANEAFREEIVVTGLTLLSCMVLRMNNILSLWGSVSSSPGHGKDKST